MDGAVTIYRNIADSIPEHRVEALTLAASALQVGSVAMGKTSWECMGASKSSFPPPPHPLLFLFFSMWTRSGRGASTKRARSGTSLWAIRRTRGLATLPTGFWSAHRPMYGAVFFVLFVISIGRTLLRGRHWHPQRFR